MLRYRSHVLLVLAALAVLFAVPAYALAAPVSWADATMFVQFWPEAEQGSNVVIVGAQIPASVPLPAVVRLPVPDGASVFWAGEIMGDDPNGDIVRQFKLVDGKNGKAIEFTAETTRSVQFDATYSAAQIQGSKIVSTLDWIQSVPAGTVSFAVRVPAGNDKVAIDPGAPASPQTNAIGEQLYTLNDAKIKEGDTYKIKVTYQRAGIDTGSSGLSTLQILLILLVVAVVVLVVVVTMQRRRVATVAEEGPADPGGPEDDDLFE